MAQYYIQGLDANGATVFIPANYGGLSGNSQILTPQSAPPIATATAGALFRVVTAGTPVIAIAANTMTLGAKIVCPPGNNGPLIIDYINPPGQTAPGTFGTSVAIQPGETWDAPFPLTNAVEVNALADNQAFTVIVF
jgi:hypothetical protein